MRSFVPRFAPWLAVVTLAAAGAAAAAGYGLTAPKRYRATAQIVVSPIPASDRTFMGIDVLRDSGGKRTAAASAAALLRSALVADAVRAQLGLTRSRDSLLRAVDARVAEGSDVVQVTAEDTSAAGAAQLANSFAGSFVNQRTANFQNQVSAALTHYRQLLVRAPAAQRAELRRRVADLQALDGQQDPTVELAAQAAPPLGSFWPHLGRLTVIGAGAGAAVGLLAAVVLLTLGRRGVRGAARYDPAMSDGAVERLVDRLEAKLSARESALQARERDLQAKLDELRAAVAATPDGASELARREAELDSRLAAVAEREAALDAAPAPEPDDSEIVRREKALAERIAAVQKREVEVARRAARLAVEKAEAPAPEPAPAPAPEPAPVAPPASEPSAAPGDRGGQNLVTLELLVASRGAEFPDKQEEWQSYLYFLREYAAADGSLPARFDGLIQETFSEVVA